LKGKRNGTNNILFTFIVGFIECREQARQDAAANQLLGNISGHYHYYFVAVVGRFLGLLD